MRNPTLAYFARALAPRIFALFVLSLSFTAGSARADGPTVIKSTIVLSTHRITSYWGSGKRDYSLWSWIPSLSFRIAGPITPGSQLSVEFTKPSGTPWITRNLDSPEITADQTRKIEMDYSSIPDEKAAIELGIFGFKIVDKNELEGKNDVIYSGHFKVGKFHFGINNPEYKNDYDYYVDNDWRLPIGYLGFDRSQRDFAPPLVATMWAKASCNNTIKAAGYLYYNGKLLTSTSAPMGGSSDEKLSINTADDSSHEAWHELTFEFNLTAESVADATNLPRGNSIQDLSKNPGDYEIKVLWDGKLARSMKFKVGDDGKIVDADWSKHLAPRNIHVVFPVTVIGTSDGEWNPAAYRTEAYYGNPIEGLSSP